MKALTNRTGSQMESDCRFLGKVIVHFHICVFWAWGDLTIKYFFCASRTVEAISGVLRKDNNASRPSCPLLLHTLSPHFLFYARTSLFLSHSSSKMMTPLETSSIMSNSHRHTPESHCILCGSAYNNFLSILFAEKIVASSRKRTS